MRSYKVSKKDFESIFTRRELTFRERYMQDFIFIDKVDYYELHQKLSAIGKVIVVTTMPILMIATFIFGGVKGCIDLLNHSISYISGKSVRQDFCHKDHEGTIELIKLAGWE